MAGKSNFQETIQALFDGLDGVLTSKTVVGDEIHLEDMSIIPLVDVSFGIGAGAKNNGSHDKGSGAIGGKITPSAVLVIQDGKIRLVNIKNQDTITKIMDATPDIVDRFTAGFKKEKRVTEEDVANRLSKRRFKKPL